MSTLICAFCGSPYVGTGPCTTCGRLKPSPIAGPVAPWKEAKRQVFCTVCGLCALILPSMRSWPMCCGEQMESKEAS